MIDELSKIVWQTEIESVQEMWNCYENEIISAVDRIASLEQVDNIINRTKLSPQLRKKLNRRSYILKKRKRKNLTVEEKMELKDLNYYVELLL